MDTGVAAEKGMKDRRLETAKWVAGPVSLERARVHGKIDAIAIESHAFSFEQYPLIHCSVI